MVRMGVGSLLHRMGGRRCPINVMLAVTNRCNCNCRYCGIPQRDPQDIPTEGMLRLIDEMQRAGTARLGLWGGEPLLRHDIGKLISHARRRGLYVSLDTNGLLWRERQSELRDLDHAVFSIDGDRPHHEANRGRGTFDRAMMGLETAARMPGLKVWTLTVLTTHNLDSIDFMLETAERLNIYAAFQILHHNDSFARHHEELRPQNERYRDTIRYLIGKKREGARISASSRYLQHLLEWTDYSQATSTSPSRGRRCKAGRLYCNIDANGQVYACSMMVDQAESANALEVGFREAFDRIPPIPCQSCTAACFTEYNYLFDLDPLCVSEWIRTTSR